MKWPRDSSGSFLLCRKAMVVKCGASAEGLQRVRWAPLKQTGGLQGHFGGGWGDLAGNDLGTDSGWKQSRQNQTPLRGDETRSPSPTAHLDTALAAQLHFSHMLANYFLLLQPLGASQRAAKGDRRGGEGGELGTVPRRKSVRPSQHERYGLRCCCGGCGSTSASSSRRVLFLTAGCSRA